MTRSPKAVYERFVHFEEAAAEIYLNMAARFCPENQELSALWLDMGMQEKEHAGLLQFCVAEELFAASLPDDEGIYKISRLFDDLKKRASRPDLTAHDAFEIAIQMETSEVNDIYCYLTTPVHNSMYLLRRKIAATMPDHVERLMHEAKKYGVDQKCSA